MRITGYNIVYASSGNNIITVNNYSNYNEGLYSKKTAKVNGKNTNVKTQEVIRGVSNKGNNIVSVYNAGTMDVKNNFFSNQNGTQSTFKLIANRVLPGPANEKIIISKWQINSETLKGMINSNKNDYVKVDSVNGEYVWFSLPCILHNANTFDANYSYVALNTAYDATCGFNKNSYDAAGIGYDFGSYDINDHITCIYPTQSIINLYDNKLVLPDEYLDPHEVYVRHVECDANGNIVYENGNPKLLNIANSQEIKIDSNNKESIINNTSDKIPVNKQNVYQEYYNISLSDKLKVSRSLTIASNKTMYNYKGYTVSSASTLSDAEKQNSSKTGNGNNTSVTVSSNNNKKTVTIVTFKYTPETITTDTPPQGGVETLDSEDTTTNCQMSYTPTNVDIKPYLVASKFKLKDLKYQYTQNGDNVQYSIKTFNIDKLTSGTISNNDSKGTEGQIFGGDNDKWTLLSGTSPQEFPVNYGNIEEITTYINNYSNKLPPQSELNSFVKNSKTNESNFSKTFYIPENRYNGLRIPKLIANYQEYNVLSKTYTGAKTQDDTSNTANVLVYNPIKVETPTVKSEGVIDHSTSSTDSSVIQKNANFELSIKSAEGEFYTGHNYSEYLSRYYLIFDIDIVKTENTEYTALYNTSGDNLVQISKDVGDVIPRGTLIELNKNATTFKAKASNNSNTGDIISQDQSNITLIGVSNNMPGDVLRNYVLTSEKLNTLNAVQLNNYISVGDNTQYTIDGTATSVKKDYCDASIDYTKYKIHDSKYYEYKDMYGDAYYFAKAVKKITNIGRIYDFKITDCSDVDYKSTFRKTGASNINDLTGIQYFSGLKEFSIYSNDVNTLVNRENISISSSTSSKTIIPLGPYKSTNTSYINAPKMGYRISFDLKTSGYYKYTTETASNSTREILIKPSYYYISKDGKTFKDGINLYYKNSSGKYVKFVGSDYTIYFKPKDGYRSISNSATAGVTDVMSEQLEPLVIGSNEGFTLNYKMMSTADNNFVQAWYGEFKLPNSTIAVEGTNTSKPLTDGYIGVRFDITCIDTDSSGNKKTISYNTNNKNASPNTNTTQWDYEGFIGFDTPGQNANNLSIQLEKGTWVVNDTDSSSRTSSATYNDIKGTVVLFDTDNRAANDFD